jgi:hypothetical protein
MDRGVCEHFAPLGQRCARCLINVFWDHQVTAQTTAQRQKAFKAAQRAAGLVRVEFYATEAQRAKVGRLGGSAWLLKQIDKAKEKV